MPESCDGTEVQNQLGCRVFFSAISQSKPEKYFSEGTQEQKISEIWKI